MAKKKAAGAERICPICYSCISCYSFCLIPIIVQIILQSSPGDEQGRGREGGESGGGAETGENIAPSLPFSNYFSGSSKDAQRLMKDQWIL